MRRHLFALISTLIATTSLTAADLRHREDASLRAICFIDDKEGWIAGDEGVILHTLDGGKNWQRQATDVRASLRSIQFFNPAIGWAAGREELPYGMGSVGVLLFTSDGGLTWKEQLRDTLPGLNQVRFIDQRVGFLLGDGNDQFPSGIFKTSDSGKSWEPVAGPRTTSWLSGDFFDGANGVLTGAAARLGFLRNGQITLADQTGFIAGRDVTGVRILGKKTLAVGQGGLVISSSNAGEKWGFPEWKVADAVRASLEFHAMNVVKNNVWVVGRPGSVVAHSADAGATWTLLKTGQPLPLHAVFFMDDKLGWAVGDAGTILDTEDGGKTWTTRHQGGKRLAALCVHTLNKTAPVDTLAHIGGAEGYLTASLRITAPDARTATWDRSLDVRRYAAAMRAAGGMTGETLWHFPLPQYLEREAQATLIGHWNKLHKEAAGEELLRQLVLGLRMWRPSVVVGDHVVSKSALSALLDEALTEAVRRAADAKAFPEQIDELGLSPWTVERVWRVVGDAGPHTIRVDHQEPKSRLSMSVRDYAATAQGLLNERYTPLPAERGYQLPSKKPTEAAPTQLLDGIACKPGETRREFKEEKVDDKLRQAVVQQNTTIAIAENIDNAAEALKLIQGGLDKLPDEHAAMTAFAIAGRYAERGKWMLAQEVYLYLVDRCPAHPLSAEAYRWLLRFNTSREAKRRHELKDFGKTDPLLNLRSSEPKILRVGAEEPAGPGAFAANGLTREWNKSCFSYLKRLAWYGPAHAFQPQTQFCVQSARRQLGDPASSHDWMTKYRKMTTVGPWSEAAQGEVWLLDRSQPPPRRVARARYTEVRPFLDGQLDDPCWKDWKPMVLDPSVGDTTGYKTEAMFAFDQEFVYIALKCSHPAGQRVAPLKPRPIDADVDAFDRVSILIDLDRDYTTAYHLEIDQRGCVRDSCWGDRKWNPKWFVAVHSNDAAWQIEAAIPISELASERITQTTAWAFNLTRVLPGRGLQSWSQPADVTPRLEGMSLLLFELGNKKPMPGS